MGILSGLKGKRQRRSVALGRIRRSVGVVVDALEPRRLFYAPIPAGYGFVETMTVSFTGSVVTSTHELTDDVFYRMIAKGSASPNTYTYDAEYRWDGTAPANDVASVDVGVALGSGTGINWGTAQSDHAYSATVEGTGSALSLKYLGGSSAWSGSIFVDLYVPLQQIAGVPAVPRSGGGLVSGASGATADEMSNPVSPSGVRYSDGSLSFESTDLQSDGFGRSFGQTRVWSSTRRDTLGITGYGWSVSELPYLQQPGGSTGPLVLINGDASTYYDPIGTTGNYGGRYYDPNRISASGNDVVLRDGDGATFTFNGFGSGVNVADRGQLKSFTDAGGNVTTVTYASSRISSVSRTFTGQTPNVSESWNYTYLTSGLNLGLLEKVALVRTVGGTSTTIRSAEYEYYSGTSDANSGTGDLKQVVIKDGNNATIESKYYRYLTTSVTNSGTTTYTSTHLVKLAVEGRSFARADASSSTTVPATMADSNLDDYADRTLTWSNTGTGSYVVSEARIQGQGGSATNGFGVYKYSYSIASHGVQSFNSWKSMTVEQVVKPTDVANVDAIVQSRTVYANPVGQVMGVKVQSGPSGSTWDYAFIYDDAGRMIKAASPSAMANGGISDTFADLLDGPIQSSTENLVETLSLGYANLADGVGLVTVYSYFDGNTDSAITWSGTDTPTGSVKGRLESVGVRNGETGALTTLSSVKYIGRDTVPDTTNLADTFIPAEWTTENGSDDRVRRLRIASFHGNSALPNEIRETVEVGGTGPSTITTRSIRDAFGRTQWYQDGDGFIHYFEYDVATGAQTLSKIDTVTSVPSGWQTNAAGGLTLATTTRVDAFGRPTKVVDPAGRVTFMIHDDLAKSTRTYRGWTGTNTATGPTEVVRDDWARGYIEYLTMRATASQSGNEPTGSEGVSSVVSLSRQRFTAGGINDGTDRYFSMASATYSQDDFGTAGTNFYRTSYTYHPLGLLEDTVHPTGTIEKNLFDNLGRNIGSKVGTSSGNLVQVSELIYDNGGVGDGRLTEKRVFPGLDRPTRVTQFAYDWRNRLVGVKEGAESGTEGTNVNRRITVYELDVIGQVKSLSTYDGDGISLLDSSGLLNSGALDSAFITRSSYVYDKLGRVFEESVSWSGAVTASSGTVGSDRLVTRKWYDNRGNLIKVDAPGRPVIKYAIDGAGRTTAVYQTDGFGDGTGNGATADPSLTNDRVVEQTEYVYDGSGNVIQQTTRQRFHDASLSTIIGNLSGFSSSTRISYTTYYYDPANRLTDSADYGTNGASSFTRNSSVPSRSDTVLVTSYSYDTYDTVLGGTWVTAATDPRGIVNRTYRDLAGRTVRTVEAYDGGSITSSTNRTTDYTYNGTDKVTRMFADLGGGNTQSTEFIYGVGTNTYGSLGSALFSNELLAEIRHTDPTTGSSSYIDGYGINRGYVDQTEYFAYDATGARVLHVDRIGTAHVYLYDLLGRLTEDKAGKLTGTGATTTFTGSLPTSVALDNTVLRLNYTYDAVGRLTRATSSSTSDGTAGVVRNEVVRTYNGFGQLEREYQSPLGAVNLSTTPFVAYGYITPPQGGRFSDSSNASGEINATRGAVPFTLTYPDGRTIVYSYDNYLDQVMGRPTAIGDALPSSTNTATTGSIDGIKLPVNLAEPTSPPTITSRYIERYTYLGASTVIERAHPDSTAPAGAVTLTEASRLTYLATGSYTGDAGDKYVGLDRFGRIVDQRWTSASNSDLDRYQYNYDRNSNHTGKINSLRTDRGERYGYDTLNRLASVERGTVTFSGTTVNLAGSTSAPTSAQSWSLDPLGNWNTTSNTVSGTTTAETRTHDKQNRLTSKGSSALTYDPNGNIVVNDRQETITYDAWNRTTRVGNGATLYSSYAYDALRRRIATTTDTGGGRFDATFGSGTGSVTSVGTSDDRGRAVAVQSDGKIVVAGFENGQVLVLRYNSNGTLDTSFGTSGKFLSNIGSGNSSYATSVTIDSSGKIVIAGVVNGSNFTDAFVARLLSSGALDTQAFGTGGVAQFDIAGTGFVEEARRLAIRPDGKILVLSRVAETSTNRESVAVTQFTTGGVVDSTNWATTTSGHFRWGYDYQWGRGIALLSDGNLIVTGHQSTSSSTPFNGFALRVLTDGTLDTSFGTSGVASFGTSEDDQFEGGVVINDKGTTSTADDKIIIAGSIGQNIYTGPRRALVAQLTATGALDTSFSGDGIAEFAVQYTSQADTISLQSDGRILVAGKTRQSADSSPDAVAMRINSNGTLDATFGNAGITTYNLGFDDFAYGSAVFSSTRLLIAGAAVNSGSTTFNTTTVALTLGGIETTAFFYSRNWQLLEERAVLSPGGVPTLATVAKAQNIWSTVYVDALAARDRDADGTNLNGARPTSYTSDADGEGRTADGTYPASSLEQRLYLQHDANFNVTSLVQDADDTIVERYAYLPYGQAEILTKAWGTQQFTAYANPYRFQGLRLDPATGLHHARFRDYADWLGRWTQQDPAGWPDGVGRAEFVRSSPVSAVDPSGLRAIGSTDPNAWNYDPYLAQKSREPEANPTKPKNDPRIPPGSSQGEGPKTDPSGPPMDPRAYRELAIIRVVTKASYFLNVLAWSFRNQCDDQNKNLRDKLLAMGFKYWDFTMVGGQGKVLHHQVVLVQPIGHPSRDYVADGFQFVIPFTWGIGDVVPYDEFVGSYPHITPGDNQHPGYRP